MKKIFFSLVATMMATTVTFAQSSMLATLSHDGEITTFYGASALKEAHEAAVDGDIITLSSGTFVATNITKGLTIRGAGMDVNSESHQEPTVISGDFSIGIRESTIEKLTIESIYSNHKISFYGTISNATFIKNRFRTVGDEFTYGKLQNATFIHCKFAEKFYLWEDCSASCFNCIIWEPQTRSTVSSNFELVNCLIHKFTPSSYLSSSTLRNCIILHFHTGYPFDSSITAYNCLAIRDGEIFKNIPNQTNWAIPSMDNIFKNFYHDFGVKEFIDYSDSYSFELTDEAAAKYLGSDGTQVGIYGGTLPFSSTPSTPQITKCNVAAKSTADGKLSVDIEVSSAE